MNALKPRPPFHVLILSEESRLGREQIEVSYALKQLVTSAESPRGPRLRRSNIRLRQCLFRAWPTDPAGTTRCCREGALFSMWYNFGRVHQTLRVAPAMETGVANHVWSVEEIVALLR
jgi:hypothetical protein